MNFCFKELEKLPNLPRRLSIDKRRRDGKIWLMTAQKIAEKHFNEAGSVRSFFHPSCSFQIGDNEGCCWWDPAVTEASVEERVRLAKKWYPDYLRTLLTSYLADPRGAGEQKLFEKEGVSNSPEGIEQVVVAIVALAGENFKEEDWLGQADWPDET